MMKRYILKPKMFQTKSPFKVPKEICNIPKNFGDHLTEDSQYKIGNDNLYGFYHT